MSHALPAHIDKPVRLLLLAALLLGLLCHGVAAAATLSVMGPDGEAVGGYRWLLEEDTTYHVQPGVPDPDTLSVRFHSSYMPVVAKGDQTTPLPALDASKHYFVSVLPDSGYTIGGAQIAPGQGLVRVVVNPLPLPTAQITIFVFEDNFPINNAADLPAEPGLAGFSILLEDAGGRYGISAGQQMMDAFGNPLGTTYNPDGSVAQMGTGVIKTGPDGTAVIRNLAPGKYGVQAVPPPGQGWVQTSTIEGTKVIDAWVKANEPPYFQEFGPPGYHVAIGFVKPMNDTSVLTGGSTISGQVVNLHLSRPPDYAFYNGAPFKHTTPWVGLNLQGGVGRGVFAKRCNPDGTFAIPNVPPGNYQLVVWDDNLDLIFAFHQVNVPPGGGAVALGDVPVFQWFSRLENYVFYDADADGFRDPGEMGIPEQLVNLRWRDGTVYQSMPTDSEGYVPFDEVFPFFAWLVAEVDFARFKATGVTAVVDEGGPINAADPWTFEGQLNPQPQPQADGTTLPYRTELGPVLTQAFQGFLGQTSVLMWGKKAYGPGENGGISGVVYYSTTRAEDNPELAAPEPWEPGIPHVTVRLYDATGTVLLNETVTDSWDDATPSGCPGEPFVFMGEQKYCYDGLRCFNQVRPGVFDGGYAFTTYWSPSLGDPAAVEMPLPAGQYVVEVVPPPGYAVVRSEDKNVDFGDEYVPSPMALPPPCCGEEYTVGPVLTLFPGVPAPLEGRKLYHCDRKLVRLSNGQNAAADFHLFTEVPIAGHIYGFVLDDTANEFDPTAPTFGEKYAPPWLPVSIRDWTGREIARTYTDQYGVYNALVPSTYTANLPQPSGMSPNMITVCLNSPVMPDPNNPDLLIPDPYFNRQYSQFCYTFQYMPGTTTYLDTPVVPVAAFAGPDQFPLDCELPDGTPAIHSVSGPGEGGPYVPAAGQQIAIVSLGANVAVPNPQYDGPGGIYPKTITRDYSFGSTPGQVTIGGRPLTVAPGNWTPDVIVATVPAGVTTGQLEVIRGDNQAATVVGVTVTVGADSFNVRRVPPQGQIQPVIDAAQPGDLILVPPGVYEELVVMWKPVKLQGWGAGSTTINAVKAPAEKLLFWRQKIENLITTGAIDLLPGQEIGFGGIEPVTLFNEEGPGVIVLAKDLQAVRGGFGLLRGQPNARIDGLTITGADHAGGIMVNGYAHYLVISNNRIANNNGVFGGGIRVGHPTLSVETAQGLQYQDAENDHIRIHHNHISQNSGLGGAGGGVSLCHGSDFYEVSENFICGNFTLGDGGGIGHYGLSESNRGYNLIANNTIIFNESFNQGQTVSGGGIYIGGAAPLGGAQTLSPGAGPVKIIANLILGNAAGAGDGGGIRTERVNGQDVATLRNRPTNWYRTEIYNNLIVNNVAALAGGGISMLDTARVDILCNTVANNDSTATAGNAFSPGSPNQSDPQPAGIVSYAHSPELAAAFGPSPATNPYRVFSNPRLIDNIIWHNRSFYFYGDPLADPPVYGLLPDPNTPVFRDLAVLGTASPQQLNPTYCLLTNRLGYSPTNLQGPPAFVAEYYNGDRGQTVTIPEITTAIQAPPAFDEGGNFIRVRFGPLTLRRPDTGQPFGNYHLTLGSTARDAGTNTVLSLAPELRWDFDGQARPNPNTYRTDMGADEYYAAP